MPGHKQHETIAFIAAAGLGTAVGYSSGISYGLALGSGIVIHGLLLSNDLDVRSKPYRRWGVLRFIWWPYKRLIPHRHWLSHAPIVGTSLRILYMVLLLYIVSSPLHRFGFLFNMSGAFDTSIQYFFTFFIGCVVEGTLHSLADSMSAMKNRVKNWKKNSKKKIRSKLRPR